MNSGRKMHNLVARPVYFKWLLFSPQILETLLNNCGLHIICRTIMQEFQLKVSICIITLSVAFHPSQTGWFIKGYWQQNHKIVQLNFFREITTFTSRLLSFDIFFLRWSWLLIFYEFKPNFLLEAGQILERSQYIQIL